MAWQKDMQCQLKEKSKNLGRIQSQLIRAQILKITHILLVLFEVLMRAFN